MKKVKKFLSLMLCSAFLCSYAAIGAMAAENDPAQDSVITYDSSEELMEDGADEADDIALEMPEDTPVDYDSVTEFPDGGKDYIYHIDGMEHHYLVPPEGFNPLTATDEELERYCFPSRPKARSGADYDDWASLMGNYSGTPEPGLSIQETSVDEGPSPKLVTPTNWSGYSSKLIDESKFYTQAQMSFQQPAITVRDPNNLNSYWVGFGGALRNGVQSKKLAQAGTCTQLMSTHNAFYQLKGTNNANTRMVKLSNLPVKAGNKIYVYITFEKANNKFTYYIANNSTGKSASGYVNTYAASDVFDGTTVEYVVERCRDSNGNLFNLGNYGSVTFTNCNAMLNTGNSWISLSKLDGLQKETIKYGNVTSTPGTYSGSQFTCKYSTK